MNSQTLTKINGFVKKRLIELSSSIIILIDIFLLLSILSYSPSDPNFIYNPENIKINNIGGFYGSVISDLLLQSFGLISFFIILNLFIWGVKLFIRKGEKNLNDHLDIVKMRDELTELEQTVYRKPVHINLDEDSESDTF